MTFSLCPFPRCAWVQVPVTPLAWVLVVGKLWDTVPRLVPEVDTEIVVFVDLPGETPLDGLNWLGENISCVERKAAEWLIAPPNLN